MNKIFLFPARDILTETEFEHLRALDNSRSHNHDPSRVEEHLCGTPFSDYESEGRKYLQLCDETKTATFILWEVFSGAVGHHWNHYEEVYAVASPAVFQTLATDFNRWSAGKSTQGNTRSGMMPLLAKILTGQINHNPAVVTPKNSHLVVPGIFTRPDRITDIESDTPSWVRINDEKKAHDAQALNQLSLAAFGIDMHDPEKQPDGPAHNNLTSTVLASAVNVVGQFRNPVYDGVCARHFANAVIRHRPDLGGSEAVVNAVGRARENMDAIAKEIAGPRAALGNWAAMQRG